jgi:hypothetical protein
MLPSCLLILKRTRGTANARAEPGAEKQEKGSHLNSHRLHCAGGTQHGRALLSHTGTADALSMRLASPRGVWHGWCVRNDDTARRICVTLNVQLVNRVLQHTDGLILSLNVLAVLEVVTVGLCGRG